jgi:hypothetical protein
MVFPFSAWDTSFTPTDVVLVFGSTALVTDSALTWHWKRRGLSLVGYAGGSDVRGSQALAVVVVERQGSILFPAHQRSLADSAID